MIESRTLFDLSVGGGRLWLLFMGFLSVRKNRQGALGAAGPKKEEAGAKKE